MRESAGYKRILRFLSAVRRSMQNRFSVFFTAAFPDWKKVHISLFLFSQRKAQKGFTGMGQYCKIDTK